MKIIPSHKANLRTAADVVRMIRYIYGRQGEKVLATITNGHFPGLVTGDPRVDAMSLTACHPGGRAATCRNIVFSTSFFSSREVAMEHVPAVQGVVTGFMGKWLSNTPALAAIHISEGKGRYKGQWRLDAHLLPVNHDIKTRKALQFTRADAQTMQAVEDYTPPSLLRQYGITRGKGHGEEARPKGTLIYPYSRGIESLEIGKLNNKELENYVKDNELSARRRKNGSIISIITSTGRKLNIASARAVHAHVTGEPRGKADGVHHEAQPEPTSSDRVAGAGNAAPSAVRHGETGTNNDLSRRQDTGREVGDEDLFQRRSRRLVRSRLGQRGGTKFSPGWPGSGPRQSPTLAHYRSTRTVLRGLGRVDKPLADIEDIEIF